MQRTNAAPAVPDSAPAAGAGRDLGGIKAGSGCSSKILEAPHLVSHGPGGRFIVDRKGRTVLLAVENHAPDGSFPGRITDPLPVAGDQPGRPLGRPSPAASSEYCREFART